MTPIFHTLAPTPALRDWVRHHQIIRFRFATGQHAPIKPYWPRPACALAFYPRDPETLVDARGVDLIVKPRATLIGQPTVLTHRRGGADFCVYQIEFRPGALQRLMGGGVASLTDAALDAEAAFPDLAPVADRITAARTAGAMVAAAEAWLLRRVEDCRQDADPTDWAAARLVSGEARSLERLAGRVGMNVRTFHRTFRDRMGVSPKLFARIARLDRMIRLRNAAPDTDWLSLAIEAGFYDHQHMARDFRALCLSSPTAFYAGEQASPERRFGLSER